MDFPGLDPKKLTDDQLMNKISDLHGKLVYAYNFSNSQEMVSQFQWLLETLQFEQSERAAKKSWEIQNKRSPDIIETDPDLVEKKKDDLPSKKKAGVASRGGSLLKRSRTPDAGGTTES